MSVPRESGPPRRRRIASRTTALAVALIGALALGGAVQVPTAAAMPALADAPAAAQAGAPTRPDLPESVPSLVPQPTDWIERDGEWRPDATTRILIVTEMPDVYPASAAPPPGLSGAPEDGAVPDTAPSTEAADLAAEAARLAAELLALGVVNAAPELLIVTPAEAESMATAADVRLRTSGGTLPDARDGVRDEDGRLEIGATGDAGDGEGGAGGDAGEGEGDGGSDSAAGTGVTVSARTDAGMFRATRALLQLLTAHEGAAPAGVYDFIADTEVRSVHLDIARKTYSLEFLKQLVDELAWNGLNELELHFSEFEGFALESFTHPEIQSATVLTQAQLRELLAYAEAQHVTVTPSLDMPGHLEHVLEALPQYRLYAADGSEVYGALDITNPDAIAFTRELIDEYAALFEPGRWNLGADEFVDFDDDGEVAALTAAAQAEFGTGATAFDTMTAFVNDTAAHLAEWGFTTRVWSDGMLRASVVTLDPAVEVAHWTRRPPGAVPASAFADAGHQLVNVNDEYLYFVLGERVEYFYPTGEGILDEWRPTLFAGDDSVDPAAVTGAMFAIWSDIPDALSEDEVLAKARLPIQAMSVRAMSADAPVTFPDLVAAAVAIGPAPAGLDGVTAAPIVPPELPDDATAEPTQQVEETGAGAISKKMLLSLVVVAITTTSLVLAVVLGLRRRSRARSQQTEAERAAADTAGLPTHGSDPEHPK